MEFNGPMDGGDASCEGFADGDQRIDLSLKMRPTSQPSVKSRID